MISRPDSKECINENECQSVYKGIIKNENGVSYCGCIDGASSDENGICKCNSDRYLNIDKESCVENCPDGSEP